MSNDFDPARFLFVTAYTFEDFVMGENIVAFNGGGVVWIPSLEKFIVVLKSIFPV
jgi:hypothetical protein